MNVEASGFTQLIFTYGPFALLVFFLYVAESKARAVMQGTEMESRKPFVALYLCTWVAIFVLLAFSSYTWYLLNLSKPRFVTGTIGELIKEENIFFNEKEEMYLRRTDSPDGSFTYEWHWYPRAGASSIPFTFSRSKDDEHAQHYSIPLKQLFFAGQNPVQVVYFRKQDKLVFKYSDDGKEREEELKPVDNQEIGRSFFDHLGGKIVHAQSAFSEQAMTLRLQSDNPDVRSAARSELTAQGLAALPYIEKILADRESNFHLVYAALWALNATKTIEASSLSANDWISIEKSASSYRPEVQSEAKKFLSSHGRPGIVQPSVNLPVGEAFVGAWRLELRESKLPVYQTETRTYRRKGKVLWVRYEAVKPDRSRISGEFPETCDGKEHVVNGGQRLACEYKAPSRIEGTVSPPTTYYTLQVTGDVLNLLGFSDPQRAKLKYDHTYHRISN